MMPTKPRTRPTADSRYCSEGEERGVREAGRREEGGAREGM